MCVTYNFQNSSKISTELPNGSSFNRNRLFFRPESFYSGIYPSLSTTITCLSDDSKAGFMASSASRKVEKAMRRELRVKRKEERAMRRMEKAERE